MNHLFYDSAPEVRIRKYIKGLCNIIVIVQLCSFSLTMSLKLSSGSGIGNRKTPCIDKIIPGLIPYLPREKRWGRACREQIGSRSLVLVGGHTREILRDQTQVSSDGGWIDLQDLEG